MDTHQLIFRVLSLTILVVVIDFLNYFFLRTDSRQFWLALLCRKILFPSSILYGIALWGYSYFRGLPGLDTEAYRNYFFFTGLFVLIWLPRLAFLLGSLLFSIPGIIRKHKIVSRLRFPFAFGLAMLILLLTLYGIFIGKTDFNLRHLKLKTDTSQNIPSIRIVQFSDTHLGSFGNKEDVIKGLELINAQQPDVIAFTGDLINVIAEEAWPYKEAFSALQAPLGKYAILGNHDIGDYLRGDSIRPPEENRRLLREFFREAGFVLLEDSAVLLHHKKDSLVIAGVDNWGLPPFRKEGDLQKALSYFPNTSTLLLSHDPTHWEAEVLQHPEIFLTLSGHTHGMQMGFISSGSSWSPAQYKYPYWGGLYQKEEQFLHVSVGFGFIGLPLRIGMRPEIVLIELSE